MNVTTLLTPRIWTTFIHYTMSVESAEFLLQIPPHNWQYFLLAHWLNQYISSIQNTPCTALSSDSNPAHYSDSNCTHPLTVYKWHAHHRHEQAPAYHHTTIFTLWNYHTLHSKDLKGISNPTLVTTYVYKRRITKGRKEGKKEGRIPIHIKPRLHSKH